MSTISASERRPSADVLLPCSVLPTTACRRERHWQVERKSDNIGGADCAYRRACQLARTRAIIAIVNTRTGLGDWQAR